MTINGAVRSDYPELNGSSTVWAIDADKFDIFVNFGKVSIGDSYPIYVVSEENELFSSRYGYRAQRTAIVLLSPPASIGSFRMDQNIVLILLIG